MTVLLLGDSHLAYPFRDYPGLLEEHLGSVDSRAFGGAVADDLSGQARGLDLGSYDTLVVSVGTNDAFLDVPPDEFRTTVSAFLDRAPSARWVLLGSPGSVDPSFDDRTLPYVTAFGHLAASYDVAVVPTRQLLAPLGGAAFVGDAVHLSAAAYDVLVPQVADQARTTST